MQQKGVAPGVESQQFKESQTFCRLLCKCATMETVGEVENQTEWIGVDKQAFLDVSKLSAPRVLWTPAPKCGDMSFGLTDKRFEMFQCGVPKHMRTTKGSG